MKGKIIAFLFLFIASKAEAQEKHHKDCRCWITSSERNACPMGANLNEENCVSSGCCFDNFADENEPIRCYLALDKCHVHEQCQIETAKRRPCPRGHWTNSERVCKWRGCCYDKAIAPNCFRAEDIPGVASSRFNPLVPNSPQFRLNDPSVHHTINNLPTDNVSPKFPPSPQRDPSSFDHNSQVTTTTQTPTTTTPATEQTTTTESPKNEEEDFVFPNDLLYTLITSNKLRFRCPAPNEPLVSCGTEITSREECSAIPCCWIERNDLKKAIDLVKPQCAEPVIINTDTQNKEKYPGVPGHITRESAEFEEAAFEPEVNRGEEGDEEEGMLSASPQSKYEYKDFVVYARCPNPLLRTMLPMCEAYDRKQCIAQRCCWVFDAEMNAGICMKPNLVMEEKSKVFSESDSIELEEMDIQRQDPDYWIPAQPINQFTAAGNVTIELSCPSNPEPEDFCGRTDITKDECVSNGCCWLPLNVDAYNNTRSPCFASMIVTVEDVSEEVEDVWSEWQDWTKCEPLSPCSKYGLTSRKRDCLANKKSKLFCEGESEIISICQDFGECSQTRWTDWTVWSICSSTCSVGFRFRARKCVAPEGLEHCLNDYAISDIAESESETCNADKCTRWSDWETTMPCNDDSCTGEGFETKQRKCVEFRPFLKMSDAGAALLKSFMPNLFADGSLDINQDLSINHAEECYIVQTLCQSAKKCSPMWSDWMEWSECSDECGFGYSERKRQCYKQTADGIDILDSKVCVDFYFEDAVERKMCNSDTCNAWGEWVQSGECSGRCGAEGVAIFIRDCVEPGTNFDDLPITCFATEMECTADSCFQWGDWSDWTDCSSECSAGEMSRKRNCFHVNGNIASDGLCSDGLSVEVSPCNVDMCQLWGDWEQSECPTNCEESGEKIVSRQCLHSVPMENHPQICYHVIEPCIKECTYGWDDWSEWSECADTCTQGLKNRTRNCVREDGMIVDANVCGYDVATELDICNEGKCVAWSDWDSGECIGSCDTGSIGYRIEKRTCRSLTRVEMDRECSVRRVPCVINCQVRVGRWKLWGDCSNDCSPGVKTRRQTCMMGDEEVDPSFCTNVGLVIQTETTPCNVDYCSDWGPYTTIDVCWARCNQTRTTTVFRDCNYNLTKEVKSLTSECHFKKIECMGDCRPRWIHWGPWRGCEDKCGPSVEKRMRLCLHNGNVVEPSVCLEEYGPNGEEQERPCNTKMCSRWSKWKSSVCSKPCYGTQSLTRYCVLPELMAPENNPNDTSCYRKEQSCGPEICPFVYSEWTEWSKCSLQCSPGIQTRTRRCMNLKNQTISLSKCAFMGSATETQACNILYCRRWQRWRPQGCSLNCGGEGVQSRTRACDQKEMTQQEMAKRHPRSCYKVGKPCTAPPCEGDWTSWLSWTECSRSCGPGIRSKIRKCLKKGTTDNFIAGSKCSGANIFSKEKDNCNQHLCLTWTNWENSQCSSTCDSGTFLRKRSCKLARDITPHGLSAAEGKDLCHKRSLECFPKACP